MMLTAAVRMAPGAAAVGVGAGRGAGAALTTAAKARKMNEELKRMILFDLIVLNQGGVRSAEGREGPESCC